MLFIIYYLLFIILFIIYFIFMLCPQLASAKYIDTWIKFIIIIIIIILVSGGHVCVPSSPYKAL